MEEIVINKQEKKQDYGYKFYTIVELILLFIAIILTIFTAIYLNKYLEDKQQLAFSSGYNTSRMETVNFIYNALNNDGYIMFQYPIENNKTVPIKLVPMLENKTN